MRSFYRISDNSYVKPKLIGATKEVCLKNFLSVFWGDPVKVIMDKCSKETMDMVLSHSVPCCITDFGNAGSLKSAIEMAINCYDDNELIYFCEDDYLHLPQAPKMLEEGIKRADYVTLYDHPDKYTANYNLGEYSKVIKTESSHWRYTISTCMTFGAKVKTLKEDKEIWDKYTSETHPHDHHIFTDLGKKGRRLAVAIPGVACHTDLEFSGRVKKVLIDPWAIDMMIKELEYEISCEKNAKETMSSAKDKTGWERLVALDALKSHLLK